jgi:hypothetical protein
MSDDLDIFRHGIRRFRIGGIAVAALPLVLGLALTLAGRETALMMIIISLILLFLVFWATHCAEDVVNRLQAGGQGRP